MIVWFPVGHSHFRFSEKKMRFAALQIVNNGINCLSTGAGFLPSTAIALRRGKKLQFEIGVFLQRMCVICHRWWFLTFDFDYHPEVWERRNPFWAAFCSKWVRSTNLVGIHLIWVFISCLCFWLLWDSFSKVTCWLRFFLPCLRTNSFMDGLI